ncbi:hypothetical protein [Flavobacterium sp.]|uniref:hypothetical protein n=1 Tax=Flavobacterium sp. TaxID=239 RepID=UPI00121D3B77|nr:hypothetical protein [Flavobacterium sp.]RZJ73018.1 MAG: hypothetical protein EOO49_05145 [Flavobacterium sp.]
MKAKLRSGLLGYFFVLFFVSIYTDANAQIASWTYEPVVGAASAPNANVGTGTSAVVNNGGGTIGTLIRTGMAGTGCGAQNGVSAFALEPFDPGSVNEGNGAQFNTSTVGYQNINFTWDQRWSNTAPNTIRLQYTLNGTTWTNFAMTGTNGSNCGGSFTNGKFQTNNNGDQYRRISINMSAVTGANNNPNFGVRIVAAHYATSGEFRRVEDPTLAAGTAGTWRFDNVNFTGTLIPGPNPSVMSGTTSICAGASANIKVQITGGQSPFTLVYSNGATNTTVNNYTSNANISVSPTATTTYSIVSVTNANGQAGTGNSGTATVTVNPLPTVSATNLVTCGTGAFTMTGGLPTGGTYSIGNTYSGPSTTFTYSYTNANGCTRTVGPFTFTRNVAPSVTSQSTATQTTCQGSAFSAISVVGAGTGLSYQWYSNATASTSGGTQLTSSADIASGSQSAVFTPSAATVGTLYYYVQLSGTCSPAAKSAISGAFVVTSATVPGTVNSNQTVCAGTLAAPLTVSGQTGTIVKWQKADDAAFTTNVSDIAVTTATLASANIGIITQTTYFRAIVQNASCLAVPSNAVEIAVKATTWNGSSWNNGNPDATKSIVFEGNYTSSGNIAVCSCMVNSGNVNFQPDDTLILQDQLSVNGGSMTFENHASLVQVNNVANSGVIHYKRDTTPIRKFDYTYWSSPVQNQLLINVSPLTRQDKFYWFNASTYAWTNANPNTTTMQPGRGYIFRGPDDYSQSMPVVYHATFDGVPNNGEFSIPIFVNGANNFNLVGNPYPSAIDADLLMGDAENAASLGTGTTIYLWTHNTAVTSLEYIFSDYATYNYTGGTGTAPAVSAGANTNVPNGYIASGQSFFILGNATGTAKFKNSMRVSGNNDQFFRSAASQKDRFWLEFKNAQGYYKQTLFGYMPNATNDFDNGYDALLFEGENPINFYSILATQKLAIQGRALPFADSDVLPLGYKANAAGTFEINLMQTEGLFGAQDIFLEDLALNVIHDLKQGSYSFSTAAGTFDSRFRIRFTGSSLDTPAIGIENFDLLVFRQSENVVVKANGTEISAVEIFDLNGRKLVGFEKVGTSEFAFPLEVKNQTVIAKITTSDKKTISRKVLL